MDSCSVPTSVNINELTVKNSIKRILSDSYTLLIVFGIVSFLLIMLIIYFGKQISGTLSEYKKQAIKNSGEANIGKNEESEIYLDEDEDQFQKDTFKYQNPNKVKFYKNVDTVYNDYNKEKSTYVKANYNKDNDDRIDRSIVYKQYDDYKYEKKEKQEDN
jgi:hypothetical protein